MELQGTTAAGFKEATGYSHTRLKSWVQFVTPKDAAEWLEKSSTENRKERNRRVEAIARDLTAHKMKFTGVPLVFDDEGNILDGHHRLMAIVKSGIGMLTLIVSGIDRVEAIQAIDLVAARTYGDLLKMQWGVENANAQASIAIILWQYGRASSSPSWAIPTYAETAIVWKKYRRDIEWALSTVGYRVEPGQTSGGAPVLAAFAFAHDANERAIESAALAYKSGEFGGDEHHPMRKLRKFINTLSASLTRMGKRDSNRQRAGRWIVTLTSLGYMECVLTGKSARRVPKDDIEVIARISAMRVAAKQASKRKESAA